jgi:hypothetical protein
MVLDGLTVPTSCVENVRAADENEISGVSGAIVKSAELDVPPPGAGVATVIDALPLFARLTAGTSVVSTVPATYVVCSAVPFHLTTDASVNFCPSIVSCSVGLPLGNDAGVMEAM